MSTISGKFILKIGRNHFTLVPPKALLRWAAAEHETWLDAATNDPLLPGRILPSDYLGQQSWRL